MTIDAIKFVGLWREYTNKPQHPSLLEEKMYSKDPNNPIYLEYLKRGQWFFSSLPPNRDILSTEEWYCGGCVLVTDGFGWVWTRALDYYLENYAIELPIAFKEHILQNKDTPFLRDSLTNRELIILSIRSGLTDK